ncbi:hypothetical protein [Luteibacter sp. E-22]|uniref:hypothetical protein n=1 Tax=Luteibacter sp. E-22 TaxID=3404050 RepID=UPI003CECF9DD
MKGSDRAAIPGETDMSFGANGKVVLTGTSSASLYSNGTEFAVSPEPVYIAPHQLALGLDGRLLPAFTLNLGAISPIQRAAMARLTADGHPDPSFQAGAFVWHGEVAKAFGVQAFERVGNSTLFCAEINSRTPEAGFAIVAINDDGALDTRFGHNGAVLFIKGDALPFFIGLDIVSADDSHILLAASISSDFGLEPVLIRLTSDGAFDTSFNDSGILRLGADFPEAALAGRLMAVRQEEFIVVCPRAGNRARRYSFDSGEPDLSFGDNGVANLAYPDGGPIDSTRLIAMNMDSKGHLWFAGEWTDKSGDVFTYQHGLLVSTDKDGRPMPLFGTNGFQTLKKDQANFSLSYAALDDAGRVLFGGRRMSVNVDRWWGVVGRTLPSGELDVDFGKIGIVDVAQIGSVIDAFPEFAYQPAKGRLLSYYMDALENETTIRAFVT